MTTVDVSPGRARSLEHAAVPEVDAVERADRDRPAAGAELFRRGRDLHASLASASSLGITRGPASSTENGPTSVRRRVRQWPPSAAAIART